MRTKPRSCEVGIPKLFQWRIIRIKASPAAVLGHVNAPDADQAIKQAIREFGITDPEQQKRLAAQPVKEIFHLVAPELALVFDLDLAGCKILDDQNGLVGDFRLFYAELEELFHRSFHPVEPDVLLGFALGDFRLIGCPVP